MDHRIPFARLAAVLGASEQTVARRFRRMRQQGVHRVVGLVDPGPLGLTIWSIRIQCRPDATGRIAEALAVRDDVSWVSVSGGGSEITCLLRTRTREQQDELLLARLPRTSQVLSVSAHAQLHHFQATGVHDWVGDNLLTDGEIAALSPPAPKPAAEPIRITEADTTLLEALQLDGRASLAQLAAATGWSEGRAGRRMRALQAGGLLYFHHDLSMDALGFGMLAHLWMTVAPTDVVAVGEALAGHRELPYVGAITGSANLQASAVCRDSEQLYRYVTGRLGAVPQIRQLEIAPVLRTIKQAGARVIAGRIADPLPTRRAKSPAARN